MIIFMSGGTDVMTAVPETIVGDEATVMFTFGDVYFKWEQRLSGRWKRLHGERVKRGQKRDYFPERGRPSGES
jgi:hypothetical protein